MNLVANLCISKKGIAMSEPSDDVAMGIDPSPKQLLNELNTKRLALSVHAPELRRDPALEPLSVLH